ncbi:MAG: hypothetical protein FGM57_03175 [Candidatus Taylorbacteria bacterium]|nr:hypothetical protein [Candidatus Taylorbacteria bacterium]
MYYEKQDTTKYTPIVSIPFLVVAFIHIAVTVCIKYVVGQDTVGYSSNLLNPIIYFTAFLVVLSIFVQLRNKSAGYIDMLLAFVVLVGTYFLIN